jgi:acetyl esterase/lipase
MDNTDSKDPVYLKNFSLITRIRLWIRVRILKATFSLLFGIVGLPGIRNASSQPTYIKKYPCRPGLATRVFIPKSYKSGDALMPLYLDIHGGGFALMKPIADDKFCSEFSNKNKVLVVSLDYLKSPEYKFPAPSEGLLDLVQAVLGDESLPFDPKKVALGGFSAGGNLALSVSQYPSLKRKLGGVVAYYPPVNFSVPVEVSMASRPSTAPPDILLANANMFNWAYIKADQNLKEPLLSPAFAPREKLPPKLHIIGCEFDLLCRNSEIMAENLAKVGDETEKRGTDIKWEKNGVKWEKILGEEHCKFYTPLNSSHQKAYIFDFTTPPAHLKFINKIS